MGRVIKHIGETKNMNCGKVVTIIEKAKRQYYYKMCTSDGFEFEGSYTSFKSGTINPDLYKDHIGETNTMNCGEVVTIIEASNRNGYYKMRTSDGFEFEGSYQNFKKGTINPEHHKNRIGETKTMNCGEVVTIVGKAEKEKYYKMRTSDGFEFEGKYRSFKNGTINPNQYKSHIGETNTMNCGDVITIISKTKKKYYKMRTSDGFEFEGSYQSFKSGTINPDLYKDHIGETKTMNCGEVVVIIGKAEKRNYYKMRTSDGFNFEGDYKNFKNGVINPDRYKGHVGETKTMDCGLSAKCINYESGQNITICFEDGYIKEHIHYSTYNNKKTAHPDLDNKNKTRNFHGYKIIGSRVNLNGDVFYNAIRLSDGEKVYMTPQMMMAAEKTSNEV